MKRPIAAALVGSLLALVLAGCTASATFTQIPGTTKAELNGLNGSAEVDWQLTYNDVAYEVELESGTVDLEVVEVVVFYNDVTDGYDYEELGTTYEAKGLAAGDRGSFTDTDGIFRLRLTSSDGATGTIWFSQE